MLLRDGVKTSENKVSSETRRLSEFVKDTSKSLVDRLESFEDIINIEIGDTGLNRAKTLEREFDLRQLYIKYEGDNPTGTKKIESLLPRSMMPCGGNLTRWPWQLVAITV